MPLPERKEGEEESTFLLRCMSDATMRDEYPDAAQRYALCVGLAEDKDDD